MPFSREMLLNVLRREQMSESRVMHGRRKFTFLPCHINSWI